MSYSYDPYSDRFIRVDDDDKTEIISFRSPVLVELTGCCIDAIAEAVAKKIKEVKQ